MSLCAGLFCSWEQELHSISAGCWATDSGQETACHTLKPSIKQLNSLLTLLKSLNKQNEICSFVVFETIGIFKSSNVVGEW